MSDSDSQRQAASDPPSTNGLGSPFPAPEPHEDAEELTAEEAAQILEAAAAAAPEPEPIGPPPDPVAPTQRDLTLMLRELESVDMRLTAITQMQLAMFAGLLLLTLAGVAVYKAGARPS